MHDAPPRLRQRAVHQNGSLFFHQIGAPRITNELTYSYYIDELNELIENLEKFSGVKVTDKKLKEYVAKYNEARVLVAQVLELRKSDRPVILSILFVDKYLSHKSTFFQNRFQRLHMRTNLLWNLS